MHILKLQPIPTLAFIYYFRTTDRVTWRGVAWTTLAAGAVLVFINNIIIPYTVWIGAQIDTLAVNTLGLPVNSGVVVFALALILGLGWASWKAHRRGRVVLNILLLSTTMILVGFSSYASMTIRAAANPPMNSNNPNNPHALLAVLNRGAGEISTAFGLNRSFADILTGIILFFIIGCEFFVTYRLQFRKKAEKEEQ